MARKDRVVPRRQRQQRVAVRASLILERRERKKVGDGRLPEADELVASCEERGGRQIWDERRVAKTETNTRK